MTTYHIDTSSPLEIINHTYISIKSKYTFKHDDDGNIGYDLICDRVHKVYDNGNALIATGVFLELPPKQYALVVPRSSIAKKDILIANSPGLIDTSYRGEIMICVTPQDGDFDYQSLIGQSIAQLIFMTDIHSPIRYTDNIDTNTERGADGFGSTGVQGTTNASIQ